MIRINIIRSALLAEVHTYNRRYSGEPRTLMEMIRCLPKESLILCERFSLKITDLIPQRSPCAAPASCALPVQWRGPAPRLPTQVLSTFVFASNYLVCGAKIHVKIRDINPKLSTALPSLTFSHQTFNLTLTYDLAPRESGW